MRSKSDKIEVMINYKTVIKEVFCSLKSRYQNNLESMNGAEFVFDCAQLLYHEYNKRNPNHGESYVFS